MNKKQFSTINMIKTSTNMYSYGTTAQNFNQHILSLDKQSFIINIWKALDFFNYIDEFTFEAKFSQHVEKPTDNQYEPPALIEEFDFSLKPTNTIKNKYNNDNNNDFLEYIDTFNNYPSSENQFKILYWLFKICKDNNLKHEKNNNSSDFKFYFNRTNIDFFLKEAYGDKLPLLRKEKLESLLVSSPNKTTRKNKI